MDSRSTQTKTWKLSEKQIRPFCQHNRAKNILGPFLLYYIIMNGNKGAMQELVDRALEGKHSEFQLLSGWNQYFYVRKFIKATLKV